MKILIKLPVNFTVVKDNHDKQKTSKENVIDHIEENRKILKKLREIQLPLDYKKRRSHYIINNFYTKKIVRKNVKTFLNITGLTPSPSFDNDL